MGETLQTQPELQGKAPDFIELVKAFADSQNQWPMSDVGVPGMTNFAGSMYDRDARQIPEDTSVFVGVEYESVVGGEVSDITFYVSIRPLISDDGVCGYDREYTISVCPYGSQSFIRTVTKDGVDAVDMVPIPLEEEHINKLAFDLYLYNNGYL